MENPRKIDLRGRQRDAWHYLNDNKTSELFYGGGAGGGKSVLGCLWQIDRRLRYPETRGLIGRAKIAILEQSTLITFFKVAEQILGYTRGRDFIYNPNKHLISWSNGSVNVLKDLFFYPSDPDFNSLGSTEFTDAFIDESPEIVLRAYDIVKSRLRWMLTKYGLIPKILITGNPSIGWVKDKFVKDPETGLRPILEPYQKYVPALVGDNPDKDFVENYSRQLDRMHSEYDKQRLLHGNWDVDRDVQNPFAHQFDPAYHTSAGAIFQANKQLYISIDFNLNPFAITFWHCWQDGTGYHIHGIDEASIENGSIPAMIDLIKARYKGALHSAILTGDAMGNRRDLGERDNASNYLKLKRGLGLSDHQIKVPANPFHSNSRTDVNNILFEAKQPNARHQFVLNPALMKWTVNDFKNVQCDALGEIIKKQRADLNQRADFLDASRYLVNTLLKAGAVRI